MAWYTFTASGFSMMPSIKPGQIVYVNSDSKNDIEVGDIVVYKKNSLRCHRIMKKYVINRKKVYITKGDNNETMDQYLIYEDDIVGKVELQNPFSGDATYYNSNYSNEKR